MEADVKSEVNMDGGQERILSRGSRRGSSSYGSSAIRIADRFAELMLVVGIDDNTGLVPLGGKGLEHSDEDLLDNLFDKNYEAHVLAAVSSTKALYFEPFLMEDPNYPPNQKAAQPCTPVNSFRARTDSSLNRGMKNPFAAGSRGVSVNPAMITHHLKKMDPGMMSATTKGADLPISEDVIRSITTFCFPDHVRVYHECPDALIHFLVLTDVSGNKTYATCITFHKPYIIEKGSKNSLIYTLDNKSEVQENQVRCFFPQCCVVVSKHPYFYAMKEILSCMIGHVERDMEEMFTFVKDFTYTMTMTPAPPAGSVVVEMSVYNLSVFLFPAECPEKPVNDIPLHLVFLCFHADDVLRIISAVLMEQRIVFVSSNYALLTTVMECFLYFILPFRWRYTYVPILSASSLELMEAPGTFMMGCHTRHLDVVEQIDGLVVVNIDDGTITVISESSTIQRRSSVINFLDRETIPDIPQESATLFKKICKRVRFQLELFDVQRPFYYDIEQERTFRMKKCLQFNTEISFAFLELMVNLFRGVMTVLRVELRQFNKQTFMDSVNAPDRPFYEKVLATDMFKTFIEERLNKRVDYWSEYEMKTRPWAKKAGGLVDTAAVNSRSKISRQFRKPLRKQVSISTFSTTTLAPREFEYFRLPTLNDPKAYVRTCIAQLSKSLETCRDPQIRANYLYLRGVFYAAQSSTMKALDDLLSIQSAYSRLLPVELCRDLLATIPESEREEILRRKGVNHIQELVIGSENLIRRRGFVDTVTIPEHDLSLEEFVETVSLLEMATDYDTIQRLFHALCHRDRPAFVDPYTLEMVSLAYDENEKQYSKLAVPEGYLRTDEDLLRVSALIKTDFGNGRIALTDKRIFFLKDGPNTVKEVVKLRNIAHVEKLQIHSFLNAVDALVISDADGKIRFTAWLKEERNCWAMLVEEMRAGKMVAEATKDFSAIGQAEQNVLLVDAIIRSGMDENTAHHENLTQSAESMCYFSAYIAEGRHQLPQDTSQALQHRVDPNHGQRERKTVEVLLYTPGSTHASESSVPPRLWCGMGDGKVKVFDATNWTLEKTFVQTKSTVACLVAVGETQVWAGSQGIFIIDTATITCDKILTEHQDLVTDMVVTENGRFAFSASVDGSIIKWEVQTLTIMCNFSLLREGFIRSLYLSDAQLWCGTWESILVVDLEGNHLQTFQYRPEDSLASNKPEQLDCFLVLTDEIWAGCRRAGTIVVWDMKTTKVKVTHQLDCRGISIMRHIDDKIWVGTKDGTIFIYKESTGKLWKTIKAHDDAVRALCAAESRYVMTGAGSKDGKVAIWSPQSSAMDQSEQHHDED
ncbi:DENN domain-containing protein 3-like [Littorina saxatilis]|uniref:DENN domain-containing protein 3-like n=1 Tax=Littorina saxatilis TaxID=31220 RepID=UPI0038B46DBA